MASGNRKKLYMMTLCSGIISISSYILLYTHQDWVTRHFTRGGVYAALPIATAFFFSLVHGTFTSCLLHAFGVRLAKAPAANQRQTEEPSQGEVQP